MRQFDKKLFNLFYLILVLGACVLALGWSSNLVLASGIKAANTFGGWSVHVMGQKKQKVCYIHGKPKYTNPAQKMKRFNALIMYSFTQML